MSDANSGVTLEQFHEQVKRGDIAAVRTAIEHEPELLNRLNASGQSAILLAKYYGQNAMADFLLQQDPKLDFFTAAAVGHTSRVLAEVEKDPAILAQHSPDGWTVLHLATFFGHPDLIEELVKSGAAINARSVNAMQNTPLHAGVAGGKVEAVRQLFACAKDEKVDVDARQHGGWTALHGAAQNGSRPLVEMLIANGADLKARADNGQSPLDLALSRGHAEIVHLFEELGATAE